jgi:hypothetical protein
MDKIDDCENTQNSVYLDADRAHPGARPETLVLRAKAAFPHATTQELARALSLPEDTIICVLDSPAGHVLLEQIDIDTAEYVASIRTKAFGKFSRFLEREDLKPETLLSALKFALSDSFQKHDTKKPDSLIFETVISASGQVEQKLLESKNQKVKKVSK